MRNNTTRTFRNITRQALNLAFLAAIAISLVGCVGGGSKVSSSSQEFGLSLPDSTGSSSQDRYSGVRLDVIVPVFDPGIPEDPDEYEEQGVWPELRRTEAVRFAVALKQELQESNSFGDVRVAPDTKVAGDLYVVGKILMSNGEDIKIRVAVNDISGRKWMTKTYKHRVKEYHWQDIRQQEKDPYQPVFQNVVKDIEKKLKKKSPKQLAELRVISEIAFANAFVEAL